MSTLPEANPYEPKYKTNPYIRKHTLFSFNVIVIALVGVLSKHLYVFTVLLFVVIGSIYAQNSVTRIITHILTESRYYRLYCPVSYRKINFMAGFTCATSIVVALLLNSSDLWSTFVKCLFASYGIFTFSTLTQSIILERGLVSVDNIRAGYFAIYQRVFLIIRTLVISGMWYFYICHQTYRKYWMLWLSTVEKVVLLFYLGTNLQGSIMKLKSNHKVCLHEVGPERASSECEICTETPMEECILPCFHSFCYKCIVRWHKESRACPLCRGIYPLPTKIELQDGWIPAHVLLCSV